MNQKNNFIIICAIIFIAGCTETIKGRVWQIEDPKDKTTRYFPELESKLMPNRLKKVYSPDGRKMDNTKTNGLVFSGGGTRSATLTLGQLRALHELGVLNEIHYISAVSGGSWASVPFIYAKCDKSTDDCASNKYNTESESFLGKYIPPNELSELSELNKPPKKDLTGYEVMGSLGKAITKSGFWLDVFCGWGRGRMDEAFSYAIGQSFLKPFGLNEDKFFTSDQSTLDSIAVDNPLLSKNDFYITEPDKPFLIVGSTLQLKHNFLDGFKRSPYEIFPLEITPLYVGIPTERTALGKESKHIGGGYVESFMYNSEPPEKFENIYLGDERKTSVSIKNSINRFSLSDVVGTSGAAPTKIVTGGLKWLFFLPSNMGFPELNHWPITDKNNYLPDEEDFVHGDGGNIDNIGLMPLLARQVDNILVFINTQEDFDTGYAEGNIPSYAMYSDLQNYFQYNESSPKNVVFEEKELHVLYKAFEKAKMAGNPLVYCSKYSVKENKFFGVKGGDAYKPTICWFYNDKPKKWVELIEKNSSLAKEKEKILNQEGDYKHIPHTLTFGEENIRLIDRTNREVNIESNISSWAVCESANYVFDIHTHINTSPSSNTKCISSLK